MFTGVAAVLLVATTPAVHGPVKPADERPCFSRSEIGTTHQEWRRHRVERHSETTGLGVDAATVHPGWVRVAYPGCVVGGVVVVVYDEVGHWMSIGLASVGQVA
jgi:hypothetical protein